MWLLGVWRGGITLMLWSGPRQAIIPWKSFRYSGHLYLLRPLQLMVFIIHNTLTTAESFSGLLHLSTTCSFTAFSRYYSPSHAYIYIKSMRELHTIAHRSLSVAYASTFQQNAHMHEESCIKKKPPYTHTHTNTLTLTYPCPSTHWNLWFAWARVVVLLAPLAISAVKLVPVRCESSDHGADL